MKTRLGFESGQDFRGDGSRGIGPLGGALG